jgi:predicted PurR-regulated permease PerM
MDKKKRWYIIIPVVIIICFLAWYFSNILVYILVATVLSLIGRPLVRWLDKIRIGRFSFPHTLSAAVTLVVIFSVIAGIVALILPLLVNQAYTLSQINVQAIIDAHRAEMNSVSDYLISYNFITADQDVETVVAQKISAVIGKVNISDIINSAIGFTGNLFFAIFAIGFITFFFLKQERMLIKTIMLLTPVKYQMEIKRIYIKTIRLLSRYFAGLLLDLTLVIALITLGMWIFGFNNALTIGIFAGMMNVIPYIGPFIGAGIALVVGITGNMEPGVYHDVLPMVIRILGVLLVVNLLDAFFMQPLIHSNRVKAHPLEIFLVIIISGSAAGIIGMIFAVPTYTVIRIIAKEFLSKSRFVQKITEKI